MSWPFLQDGMQTHWPAAAVARQVEQQLLRRPCDAVSSCFCFECKFLRTGCVNLVMKVHSASSQKLSGRASPSYAALQLLTLVQRTVEAKL
jgi:hypothetical protein